MGSPSLELDSSYSQVRRQKNKNNFHLFVFALSISSLLYLSLGSTSKPKETFIDSPSPRVLSALQDSIAKCKTLDLKPRPPPNFHSRTRSDRYEPGCKPIVIRNATLWTGNDNGNEVLESMDVFLSKGIITDIFKTSSAKEASQDAFEIDAAGKWLTPGIIDMHVHLGVGPVPSLPASEDVNTRTAPITPYLRSLDGLNQHDLSFLRTMAGGVTTGLVLPGSGGNMGGQAFPIKLRTPASHAPSDRVIDPPESLALPGRRRADLDFGNDTDDDGMKREDGSTSWRYMKMACGENARRFYSLTRMDEAYGFRTIFNRARLLKTKQDDFCEATLNLADSYEKFGAQLPSSAEELHFPDGLELEAVVDILRGKVKVNTHCYTTTDLERMVAHTNEFKFNIAAFHHAHEAWLVPDVLKQTYGGTPAVAMFSANANYKLEAYFGTPFAGPILQSHNITPIYKSDHPVTDSRRVLNQAAQAHHFGLGSRESLRSVISAPAEALALDHRIGYLNKGWDADVVLWNNHPLALGATPVEVIVDGIRQLEKSYAPIKRFDGTREPAPKAPQSANYTAEIARVEREATDFMEYRSYAYPTPVKKVSSVLLYNVGRIFTRGHSFSSDSNSTKASITSIDLKGEGVVVLLDDKIFCSGSVSSCLGASINSIPKGLDSAVSEKVDLKRGDVLPGITTFGSPLGLADIVSEPATQDGPPSDAFDVSAPARQSAASALGLKAWPVARAADGLRLWGSHDVQRAHSAGVTTAIVPPMGTGFIRGISVRFDTGSEHPLDSETIRQDEVALHITLGKEQDAGDKPSISEQVGILRSLFAKGREEGERFRGKKPSEKGVWSRVIDGDLPLVVETSSTSAIASLLSLIKPYPYLRLVISGATTASLKSYPKALKEANVSVLISPRTWAVNWEDLPSIPGPPLTPTNTLGVLLEAGVKVGLQIEEAWQASNALFDATWSAIDAGNLDERDVVALLSTNLESILDLDDTSSGVVAFDGPAFQYGSKPVVIGTPRGVEILS